MREPSQVVPTAAAPRKLLGLYVAQDGEASAALVEVTGQGLDCATRIGAVRSVKLPAQTLALLSQLQQKNAVPMGAAVLAAAWAQPQAELIAQLLEETRTRRDDVLALGVVDPGLWQPTTEGPTIYQSLCDAARVAELTGIHCIDAFAARDVAQQGQGGPLLALPEWMLLRDRRATRVLLHLRRSVSLTLLPRAGMPQAPEVLSFDVGPGTALLDELTRKLTDGEMSWDPGGRLAVQGTQIAELLDYWLADPYFGRGLPRWQPSGVRPERFLADGIQMALKNDWSVRDVLCTATHFIAEAITRSIERHVPAQRPVEQLVLCGGGQFNGMLLRELGLRLPGCQMLPISKAGVPDAALRPACCALLAALFLDQVPANRPNITGTHEPRVLGRLTPTSPASWQRLLERQIRPPASMRRAG